MLRSTYAKIGQRVKSYRKQRGMSQDEVADGICSRQTISLLENGQHLPSVEFLEKIAERLAVPLREILLDETRGLDTQVQIEIIKVYLERSEYQEALALIKELQEYPDLLECQRRELLLNYAECLIRTGDSEGAVVELNRFIQTLEQQRESDDHLLATVYDKLGTAHYFLSNMASAYSNYSRAYYCTLRFPIFDLTAARVVFNLGKLCRIMRRSDEAVEHFKRAESFFKNVSDMPRIAHTLFEMGIAFSDLKAFEEATKYLDHSLAIYKSLSILETARRVRQTFSLEILAQNNPELAIQKLLKNVREYEAIGDKKRLALTFASLASICLTQQEDSDTEKYLSLAFASLSGEHSLHHPHYAFVYRINAKYLLKVNQYDGCLKYSSHSAEIYEKLGLEREAADSLQLSVEAYRAQKMFEKALDVSEKVNVLLRRSKIPT